MHFVITKVIVTIIGFQNRVLSTSEDGRGLHFDIAVVSGILKVNLTINFTTNDNSAQGINFFATQTILLLLIRMSYLLCLVFFLHTAGLDYNATTVSLALNPHSTMKSVYVGIIDDNIFERSEIFMGQLIAADILPENVYLEPAIATATIYDHKSMYDIV